MNLSKNPPFLSFLALLAFFGLFFLPTSVQAANMTQEAAETLALGMLTESNRNCGIIAVPNCGNGELLKAFWTQAGNPKLIVDGFTNNATSLTEAQAKVSALNLAGRNLYARSGNLTTAAYSMPYADHFLDLVAVTGLSSSTLANVSYSEVERILATGAKAWVGAATSEATELSAGDLSTWIAGNHTLSNATVVSDSTGNWAVISKISRLPNTYEGRSGHNLGGSWFYDDQVATWPCLPQWFAKPEGMRGNSTLNAAGAAGGRLYAFYNDSAGTKFCAYNVYNGNRLWERLGGGELINATLAYSQGAVRYNTMIDGKTGADAGIIPFPSGWSDTSLISYFVDNDILYVVARVNAVNTLFAYDLINKTTLYTKNGIAENKALDGSSSSPGVVASNGKLYARSGTSVYSYNMSNGNLNWSVTVPAAALKIKASEHGVLVTLDATTNLCLLSAANGSVLWSKVFEFPAPDIGKSGVSTFNGGNEIMSQQSAKGQMYDVLTGNHVISADFRGGRGCGGGVMTPQGTWANSYGYTYSFAKKAKATRGAPYTENCIDAQFMTSGLILHQQNGCDCYGTFVGYKAEAPMGTFNPDQPAVPAERLEQGPVYSTLNAVVATDSKDWSTHRANNSHSASTPVAVNTSNCTQLWKYTNPNPFVYEQPSTDEMWTYHTSTPAVTAGGYVYVAGSDGLLKCINVTTGALVWSYQTGGWIFSTPTVADGCVYVGSGDGYAYCIEAHTGKLVWRFRAAPAERRWNYYGHLISTWPILTGVLVHNENAYFVSGMRDEWGVQAYCLNAKTGALVWQNTSAGVFLDNQADLARYGHVPGGYMTVVGPNLWVKEPARQYPYIAPPAARIRMGIFDLATGTISSDDSTGGSNGRQIGLMGNYVVGWGEDFHSEMTYYQQSGQPTFAKIDNAGKPVKPFIKSSNYPDLPFLAWDDTSTFFSCSDSTKKINRSTFIDWLDATMAVNSASTWAVISTKIPFPTLIGWNPVSVGGNLRSIVLASNALLEFNTAGELAIMNRETGAHLQKVSTGNSTTAVDLYQEGLAIDRGGKIIMVSRNGDVTCYGANTPVIVTQLEGVSGIDVGEPFSLTIEAATTSIGGNLTYQWYKNGVAIPDATDSTYSKASAVEADAGSYYVEVTNSQGSVNSTAVNVSLTVTTSITSPAASAGFIQPVDITITANATSLKGAITKVEFYNGATLLGEDTTAPYSFTWANAPGGNATLTTKAYDVLGSTGVSPPVNISVAGLLAYLQFNETTGTTAYDSSSAGNNGTMVKSGTGANATWTTQSIFNGGVRFGLTAVGNANSKEGVAVGPITSPNLGNANSTFTIGFWVNTANNYKSQKIFTAIKDPAVTTGTNDSFIEIGSTFSTTIPTLYTRRISWRTTVATSIVSTSNPTAPNGQWDHYAIVATPAKVEWYINGTLQASLGNGSVTMDTSYKNFLIGNTAAKTAGFNGFIDDVKIFDSALSVSEVMTLATQYPYETMPTIALTAPAEGTVITAANSLNMTVNATGSHYPLNVTYYDNGTEITTLSTAPYSYTWTTMTAGNHTITANVTDGLGHTVTSNSRNITFTPVSTPTVDTEGGTFTLAQTISVATADSGTTIYYTTDGSVPTESSTLLSANGTITVDQSMILKLRAFKAGVAPSEIKTVIFTIGMQLTAGQNQALMLADRGNLWGFGHHSEGVTGIGDGTTLTRATLVPIDTITNVTAIAAGGDHSLAVKSDNTVWAWGQNAGYQLGYSPSSGIANSTRPIQVFGISDVISVAAGDLSSFALKSDGTVWAWGSNSTGIGQLGVRTTATPTQITSLTGIKAIAAKQTHNLALKNDGTVWAWGVNSDGQIGNNSTASPVGTPVQVANLANATAIAVGTSHSVALKSDGTVWAWGLNSAGQLGDGSTTQRLTPVQMTSITGVVKAIAAGGDSTIALLTNGTVVGPGKPSSALTNVAFIGMGSVGLSWDPALCLAVTTDGKLYKWLAKGARSLVVPSTNPPVSWNLVSQSISENGSAATITAKLWAPLAQNVTIPFTTSGNATKDTDYTISASPIVISANSTSASITITPINDTVYRGNRSVIVQMGTPTNATLGESNVSTVLINDNEPIPTVSFATSNQSVVESAGNVTITAQLSAPNGRNIVTIPFSVGGSALNPTNYTLSPSPTLSIPVGATSANITVSLKHIAGYSGDKTLIVNMGSVTNAVKGEPNIHTLTITDKEVSITAQPDAQEVSWGDTATFSVTALGTAPTYQWRKNGVPIEGATSASYTTPVVGIPDNGTVFDVVVSNATDSVTSTPAALTVLYNEAPTVSFTFPVSPAVYPSAPADVILRTDIFTNGEIVKLEFFAGATKIGETDGALNKGTTWSNVAAGNYTLTARVTDNHGQIANSAPITVEVQGTSDLFASWATLSGLSGNQTLATANPSGDGISNLMKYALGLNPNAITRGLTNGTTPGLPLVAVEGDNLTMIYQKDTTKTDITYTVESSSDLVIWSTAGISEALQTTVGDIQTKKASVPIGTDKKEYIRLKVTK